MKDYIGFYESKWDDLIEGNLLFFICLYTCFHKFINGVNTFDH